MRVESVIILAGLALLCGCSSNDLLVRYFKGSKVRQQVLDVKSEDAEVRRKAVVALGERRNADVLKILCAVLETDKDPLVRAAAAEALGKIGDASAVPLLINALNDERYMVRWDAVKALGALKAESAVSNLERAAKTDRQSDVRLAAVTALGKIGGKDVIGPLIDLLSDKDENISFFASQNLARLTGQAFGVQQEKWVLWWEVNRDKPLPPPVGATTKPSWWARWRGTSATPQPAAAPAEATTKATATEAAPPPPPAPKKKSGNWFTRLFKRSKASPAAMKKEPPPAADVKTEQ